MKIELHNLDGFGSKRTHVYFVPIIDKDNYWVNVTDIPCPTKNCDGTVIWHEAGYVAGYRICNKCGKHFLAKGNCEQPKLLRVGSRTG